jgi:hypothetical protein
LTKGGKSITAKEENLPVHQAQVHLKDNEEKKNLKKQEIPVLVQDKKIENLKKRAKAKRNHSSNLQFTRNICRTALEALSKKIKMVI